MSFFDFYGNSETLTLINSMIVSGRISHAFLFYGADGLGRNALARRFSAQILCNNQSSAPCGECKSCKMLAHNGHPDFITVVRTGKNNNYKAEDLRPLCTDAYIAPNESDKKIYFLPDFDTTLEPAQNILLKIIEEPPSHAVFVFTARSRACFLTTILSRVVSLPVSEVSKEDALKVLGQNGIVGADAQLAVSAFGGNIGRCIDFIHNENLQSNITSAKAICEAMILRDEYTLLKELSALGSDKASIKNVLLLLIDIVRDACAGRLQADSRISCFEDGARRLSFVLNPTKCIGVINALTDCSHKLEANASASISLTALCASIKDISK